MPNKKKEDKSRVHQDLEGFDIKINEFGEVVSTYSIEDLNSFLDKKVKDKKIGPTSSRTDRSEEE